MDKRFQHVGKLCARANGMRAKKADGAQKAHDVLARDACIKSKPEATWSTTERKRGDKKR